jgi:hypothetical protein
MLSTEMVNAIDNLETQAECKEAWDMIKQKWEEINAVSTVAARKLHRVGDKVVFQARKGLRLTGEIIKLNPKKAKIFVHSTTQEWHVPYRMLNKYED